MAERNLDFDRPIDRKGTKCLKYDYAVERGMPGRYPAALGGRHGFSDIFLYTGCDRRDRFAWDLWLQ